MQLSRYLKAFPYPADPEYLLLYSTKNAAMALVLKEDYQLLQKGEMIDDYTETLTELGILVPDPEQERQEVFSLLDEINRQDTGLNVSVILGMACNFACVYCYEGSLKVNQAMHEATAGQLIDFLKERYLARKKERLTLDFYGGEPLLYIKTIQKIAGPLKKFVEEQGGGFRFSLVTNGSLLTRDTVNELLPFGLYGAKVTVDGPPDEHNKLRPFQSGKPSFDTILNNINKCCDLVQIGFGGNYSRENYKKVAELLDIIEYLGLGPNKLGNVQFHPVIRTTDKYTNPEFIGGCLSVNEPWLVEASIQVREEVLWRGYHSPKLIPSPCMVDMDDAFVVNHDGRLYKCVAMIGHPEYAVGDIRSGFCNDHHNYHPDHWQKHTECEKCEYLPLCFGGCRYMEFQRSGTMSNVDCMREYYDNVLEDIVLQDASYQVREAEAG